MAKMGGSPPHFEGKNFAYWKVRMVAYLDAIAPEVWLATKTGFTGTPTSVRGGSSGEPGLCCQPHFGGNRIKVCDHTNFPIGKVLALEVRRRTSHLGHSSRR